jgi:hypothetical protein
VPFLRSGSGVAARRRLVEPGAEKGRIVSRLPAQPRREDVPPEDWDAYDTVVRRLRAMLGAGEGPPEEFFSAGEYYGALLNSPPMCATLAQLGTLVRTAGERSNTYSHADREFVDQVLSAELTTTVVQEFHLPDAIAAGVRIEAIEALRAGDDDALTPDELLLAHYIRQVVRGEVQDETWGTMLERLGTRGLVEYTVFITFLQLIMRLMQALQTSAPSEAQIDEQIARLKADRSLVPDIQDHLH